MFVPSPLSLLYSKLWQSVDDIGRLRRGLRPVTRPAVMGRRLNRELARCGSLSPTLGNRGSPTLGNCGSPTLGNRGSLKLGNRGVVLGIGRSAALNPTCVIASLSHTQDVLATH